MIIYGDLDISDFWERSDYADREYTDDPLTDEKVASVERALGYRLPESYVELMRHQNGGTPRNTCHKTDEPTSWSPDHIAITGIYAIGGAVPCSLLGNVGSLFWMEEWGYPAIGVYFADCPSAGHDMLCLDYRDCGPDGEPAVVHVDQEFDFKITRVATSFEAFIRGLTGESAFDET